MEKKATRTPWQDLTIALSRSTVHTPVQLTDMERNRVPACSGITYRLRRNTQDCMKIEEFGMAETAIERIAVQTTPQEKKAITEKAEKLGLPIFELMR